MARLRAWWFPIALGSAAAILTVALLTRLRDNPYLPTIPGVSEVLAVGFIVAMVPFGGIHGGDLPADWVIVTLSALVNAVAWFAVGAVLQVFYSGVRRARSSARNK